MCIFRSINQAYIGLARNIYHSQRYEKRLHKIDKPEWYRYMDGINITIENPNKSCNPFRFNNTELTKEFNNIYSEINYDIDVLELSRMILQYNEINIDSTDMHINILNFSDKIDIVIERTSYADVIADTPIDLIGSVQLMHNVVNNLQKEKVVKIGSINYLAPKLVLFHSDSIICKKIID